MERTVKDITPLINQIKSIVMLIVGIVLVVLLAGTTARAARLGINWLPGLGPMEMAYLGVAYWAIR
jgi:hypothetical protein